MMTDAKEKKDFNDKTKHYMTEFKFPHDENAFMAFDNASGQFFAVFIG